MKFTQIAKVLMLAAPLTLAGCSSAPTSSTDVESTGIIDATQGGNSGSGVNGTNGGVQLGTAQPILTPEEQQRQYEAQQRQQQQEQLRLQNFVIYFDYDRSDLQGEFLAIIQAHGNYLLENPSLKVLIEGHADERGTPEYNIALGERRAKAVAKYLQSMGVMGSQISIVSYGEEKPLDFTRTDAGFAKNRRAVLVY